MLKKRGDLVSFARAIYSTPTPREDEACVSVCACDRAPLLNKTV